MNKGITTTLDKVKLNICCTVKNISKNDNKIYSRLLDFGIVKTTKITPLYKSIFGNTVAYMIRGCVVALRNEDASKIIVTI